MRKFSQKYNFCENLILFCYFYKCNFFLKTAMVNLVPKLIRNKIQILLLCLFSLSIIAQSNDISNKSEFWNHVHFGGSLGLSFGDNFFSGTLAPSAIYQFENPVAVGFSINGTYNSQKDFYKSTILGASVIGLFNPI